MKKILLATFALATIAASPAFAQTADNNHMTRSQRIAAHARAAGSDAYGQYYSEYNDPYAVIVGNRVVGRDPDPNIRLELRRDVPSDN